MSLLLEEIVTLVADAPWKLPHLLERSLAMDQRPKVRTLRPWPYTPLYSTTSSTAAKAMTQDLSLSPWRLALPVVRAGMLFNHEPLYQMVRSATSGNEVIKKHPPLL